MNSGESFLIADEKTKVCYSWLGEGSSDDEKDYCKKLAKVVCSDAWEHKVVDEGQEEEAFWACFDGGKTEYATMKELGFAPGFDPRLFQLSNAQGYMHMREIFNFD